MTAKKKKVHTVRVNDAEAFEAQLEKEGFAAEEAAPGETGGGADEDLTAELEEARQEAAEAKDQMLRLAAEFENFKRRMERERSTSMRYAEESLLRELLPTIDNMERAIEQGTSTGEIVPLLEGVEMTLKGLLSTLEKYGLQVVAGVGESFDPNFHEALATDISDTVPANHVIQEYEKGYLFKDRLLRAAKVVVAKENEDG